MNDNFSARAKSPLGRFFRDMPIRQKLTGIVIATTGLAIVMAGIGILLADSFLFRNYLKTDLAALSRIIADNTTASLAFEDPATATETLGTLRARSHVVTACVFKPDGTLFARYVRAKEKAGCAAPQANNALQFRGGTLFVSRAVMLGRRRLGTLVLVYDLGESGQRVELFGAMVFGVLLVSAAMALVWSGPLRSLLATPIVELAQVTTKISSSRDYGIRAEKFSGDELGLLVDAFNEMITSIQSRDDELHAALVARGDALRDAQRARESLEGTLASIAQLNAELRRSNENLARSNEDLERFAFIASHDLQEPLRLISIHLQLLERHCKGALDEQGRKWMATVEGGSRRMRALLSDLLAYAEISARSEIPEQEVDLNAVLQKVCENLAVSITESGATVRVAELPVIAGQESNFVPLFQNLIGNAIKYRSERRPEIEVQSETGGGQLRICVSDNGIGIAPEYHSKIFVAFKRLHGNKIPGTGIGLAICQRVVEKYGGRIWVESKLGQGAKFFFTIPAATVVERNGKKG